MKKYSVNDYNAHIDNMSKTGSDSGTVVRAMCDISRIVTNAVASSEPSEGKINGSMRSILLFLSENNGSTQLEVVHATKIKAPTVSISLHKLEGLGYVTRKSDLIDLRSLKVYLTDKGMELAKVYTDVLGSVEKVGCRNMSKKEIELLTELSLKVLRNLQEV